jgi:uncharacterized RDD family membrane protein YckC
MELAVQVPRLRRRFACLVYEVTLLFGVYFIPAYLLQSLFRLRVHKVVDASGHATMSLPSPQRELFQGAMFLIIGAYFVWCWRHGGQTLPMKTWRFRVADKLGNTVSRTRAWLRYSAVWFAMLPALLVVALGHFWGFALILLPFLWALVDPDRQFLHDRIAGTRLINV